MLSAISARIACPHCDRTHAVDLDEGGMPDLDMVPCQGSDACHEKLCQDCRHKCEICDLYACEEHIKDGVCNICGQEEQTEAFFEGDSA